MTPLVIVPAVVLTVGFCVRERFRHWKKLAEAEFLALRQSKDAEINRLNSEVTVLCDQINHPGVEK
jgi:hypothetical protein